jgi:lysophospholipase L1-like esterase
MYGGYGRRLGLDHVHVPVILDVRGSAQVTGRLEVNGINPVEFRFPTPSNSRMSKRAILVRLFAVSVGLLFGAIATEGVFRILEARDNRHKGDEGNGCGIVPDDRWGWRLKPGTCLQRDPEFEATLTNNQLFMNDEPFVPGADSAKTRILTLGDSHTQALGVSTMKTWPKVLQRDLNRRFGDSTFRVYNTGTVGYNLHQYLLRLIDQGPVVKPNYVVVGFGFPSDLYDLLPPSHGGWHFFSPLPRTYFDFDSSGKLVEKHWAPSPSDANPASQPAGSRPAAARVRDVLRHFATFRYLRRSNLALAIGARVRLGGESLWPNMEVVLEKDVSPENVYNWRLTEALLDRINEETRKLGAKLVVMGIPYLPQVYDETWRATFGNNPRYAKDAGPKRLRAWLETKEIPYVETVDSLRAHVEQTHRWVHFRKDAHPTAEGHEIMAAMLAKSGLLAPMTMAKAKAK